jgi:hypothetical protein
VAGFGASAGRFIPSISDRRITLVGPSPSSFSRSQGNGDASVSGGSGVFCRSGIRTPGLVSGSAGRIRGSVSSVLSLGTASVFETGTLSRERVRLGTGTTADPSALIW